jgi:zinc transporter 9
MIAINAIKNGAKREGMSIKDYIYQSRDPSVNVVLLEDSAAVVGVIVAAGCMGLTSYLNTPFYDAVGSIFIGGLLGVVASFIVYSNSAALVGRSIPEPKLKKINTCLEDDVMIRAIHDVKATDLGNDIVRYKAEVDIDGRQLTRHYLDTLDIEVLLEDMKGLKTIEDVEAFMLKHGENIVDLIGAEIDRIERELKKKHPQLRHVDLEVL